MIEGIDIGYDRVKFYTQLKYGSFPSLTGTPETSSFGYTPDDANAIILTHPYHVAVGAQALEQSASVDPRIDRGWIGSDKWMALALAAFSEATTKSVDLYLVCGLPVAYYEKDRAQVVDKLLGQHTLQRQGRHKQTINVKTCTVMPQGFGALFAECLHDNGTVADKPLRWGRVGTLDIGGRTTNALIASKAKMINKESGSIEVGGWNVAARVLSYLENNYPDLSLTEYQLVEHIKSKTINYHGQPVDLTAVIDDAAQSLAENVIGYARRKWGGAAELDAILIAGGGAHLIGSHLLAEFPQARLVSGDPVFSNARGYWKFAQAQWAAANKK